MALLKRVLLRIRTCQIKSSSTVAQAVQIDEDIRDKFRTTEDNPANHTIQHFNRFYTVPEDHYKVFKPFKFPLEFRKQVETFTECCILVRKPALELLNYLKCADYSKPVNRYVIYGDYGCGKGMTLLHMVHYGYCTRKIMVYVPYVKQWYTYPKEIVTTPNSDLVDLPIHGAEFLLVFKNMNAPLLKDLQLTLSETYEWSPTDSSAKNSSLLEMINFGIDRIKYSCKIVSALFKELKIASISGKCQVLVALGGFNACFSENTNIKDDNKKEVPAYNVTLSHAFWDITKADWCNGQVIVTVDKTATRNLRESYFPRYLLTDRGFNHLDPFLPILVENYTQDEFDTVVDYYKNRKWIRNITPEGHKELTLISGRNPLKLLDYCKHL